MLRPVLVSLLILLQPAVAAAAGRWSTFIRPFTHVDAWADGDSVWFATQEAGALIFRPSLGRFESLTRTPGGLASNRLTSVAFDRSGRVWLGTAGAGLSQLSADRTRFGLVNELDGLPSPFVNVIESQGDTLWIGTDEGLALWNGREISGALPDGVNPSPFQDDQVQAITVFGDSVWVGTVDGIYVSRISTGITNTSFTDVSAGNGPSLPRDVRAIVSDGGTLFALASSAGNLFRWDFTLGLWLLESGGSGGPIGIVRSLSDDRGVILAGTESGLWRWDGAGWELLNGGLPAFTGRFQYALTTDAAGRVWAASAPGLFASPPEVGGEWMSWHPEGPPGNSLLNVLVDGPNVYAAADGEGLGRWNGESWRNWNAGPNCTVGCDTTFLNPTFPFMLHLDRAGVKWISFWSTAIQSFDDRVFPPLLTLSQPEDEFTAERHSFGWSAVSDDHNGHWFGMDSNARDEPTKKPIGIDYYDSTGTYLRNYNPLNTATMESGQIRGLDVDRFGRLWVGYAVVGVDVFALPTTPGDPLQQVDEVNISGGQDVFGVSVHGDSAWVLTTSNVQLFRFPNGDSASLRKQLTLPNSPASRGALHPLDLGPDGSVWVGTASGVRHYKIGSGFEDFNVSNSPLADNDVRAVRVDPATGVVWIATGGGLNSFDPAYVAPPPAQLPVLEAHLYPNPAKLSAIGIQLRIVGNAGDYRGSIHDLSGRVLKRFAGVGQQAIVWDGRDGDGSLVRPGVYFVRVEAGGRTRTARIALLR